MRIEETSLNLPLDHYSLTKLTTMESKTKTAAQQLAEARAKGREHLSSYDMKSHKNLWGMKVFSWQNSTMDEALELIMQLDNPVIWVVSSESEYDFAQLSSWISSEVDVVLSFGSSNKFMRQQLESKLGYYTRKDSLKEALALVKSVANHGATLFFAPGVGKMSEEWRGEFEGFLAENE